MPIDMTKEDIAKKLAEQSIHIEDMYVIMNKKSNLAMPLLSSRAKNPDNQMYISQINYIKVNMEVFRKKYSSVQYNSGQGFFHPSNFCKRAAKCVKCAGNLQTKDCSKIIESLPKCEPCKFPAVSHNTGKPCTNAETTGKYIEATRRELRTKPGAPAAFKKKLTAVNSLFPTRKKGNQDRTNISKNIERKPSNDRPADLVRRTAASIFLKYLDSAAPHLTSPRKVQKNLKIPK
ncbi:hypothetical protein NPIL_409931 [Nephila pilipes]|uniref:Uncharacterized protein n=1 Tax=Nephila pilipes TaxID=299642 RepID=A0A8X6MV58_NEPPI|nr:hypothetical protein NPIL_409931 [Nephila pilipes]